MGNVFSSDLERGDHVIGESEREINNMASNTEDHSESQEFHDAIEEEVNDRENRINAREAEMEEFRRQLEIKREQRRGILDRHKSEKKELEIRLDNERKAKLEAYESNKALRELLIQNNIEIPEHLQSSNENSNITESIINMQEEFEKLETNNNKLRRDLAEANAALQSANSDIADLQMHSTQSMVQINALKEVVAVSKTMLHLRENQLDELKEKLSDIERSLADREANMLSADLRQEYERQLQNIRSLRALYEERARLAEVTRQGLLRELEEQKRLKQAEIEKVAELTTKVQELEARVDELQEIVSNKNNEIYTCQDETRGLKAEMSAVNKLFSQVLLGHKNQQDMDKLVHRLEENHGILTHMAENENDAEASTALPKLLLEIVSQVDDENSEKNADGTSAKDNDVAGMKIQETENLVYTATSSSTAEEIVQNLPKVWRVLIELLSHQNASDENEPEKVTTCYKTVDTKNGPVQVPSVSQTYIRLKDLIVEKLGLVKEVNRMKQLNVHLETRLEEQERRLCLVTNELSKTWHVVGRLRRHHHQLHTHEKILKYELQQKRKLLNELKEELEYCREKWDQAREKNTQSEKDWRKLRAEFSSRNTKSSTSFNNSAESGYSDEKPSDESSESNDESEYVTEPLIRSKKKIKKSFETILDSSTDRNLAAEREDPVSDMIDVADLPLDTQEGDDRHDHDVSDSCNSESLLKSEKVCETEDEIGDIAPDSCTEDNSTADQSQLSSQNIDSKVTTDTSVNSVESSSNNVVLIDPAAILKSIRDQTERLAKKDKKLEKLEKDGAALLQKTQTTSKISNQINDTLDHLLNRPSSSKVTNVTIGQTIQEKPEHSVHTQQSNRDENMQFSEKVNNEITKEISSNEEACRSNEDIVSKTDIKAIQEINKKQNERLVKKDEMLQNLEAGGSEVVKNVANTLARGEGNIEKIDNIPNSSPGKSQSFNSQLEALDNETDTIFSTNEEISNLEEPLHEFTGESNNPSSSKNKPLIGNIISNTENVMKQDVSLGNYEEEASCSKVVSNEEEASFEPQAVDLVTESTDSSNRDSSAEPSTSSDVDHEALFAARDLRLKRLEEQTKSLVNRVNKTTDKGIKIHYKLEELHNIYGSENSRAGTPSDNEDRDRGTDDADKTADDSQKDDQDNID